MRRYRNWVSIAGMRSWGLSYAQLFGQSTSQVAVFAEFGSFALRCGGMKQFALLCGIGSFSSHESRICILECRYGVYKGRGNAWHCRLVAPKIT
jgi:hypothetical protein